MLGAGSHAREILSIIEACKQKEEDIEVLGYIVDSHYYVPGAMVNGKPILGDFTWFANHADKVFAISAVGELPLRFHFVERARQWGVRFHSLIHPKAVLTNRVTIGSGVVVAAGCVLTDRIRLGNHVHLNPGCTIGHDTEIDDFVMLAQGVNIAGKVNVSTGCYIGIGANIIDGIHVGEWSIIGAGSTIIQDVTANTTVVGVPGRVIKARIPGWYRNELFDK